MKFSQRYGHLPVRSTLQTDDIDQALRKRLWNLINDKFFHSVPPFPNVSVNFLSNHPDVHQLFKDLWHEHFKWNTDTIGHFYIDALSVLRKEFFKCQ